MIGDGRDGSSTMKPTRQRSTLWILALLAGALTAPAADGRTASQGSMSASLSGSSPASQVSSVGRSSQPQNSIPSTTKLGTPKTPLASAASLRLHSRAHV